MVVEIDGYDLQVILVGEDCDLLELRRMYFAALAEVTSTRELPDTFCRLYGFITLPYSEDLQVAFVIDTDTDRIYSPSY